MADWSTRYLAALSLRDKQEKAHKPYIDAYIKLADRKSKTATTAASITDPNDNETTHLRTLLQTNQTHRQTLQTQLSALQKDHTNLQTQHQTLTTQLTSLHRQLAAVERKLHDREEELREKKRLVGDVQDEMLTLEMELNGVVRKKEEVERENRELVRRWMERMGLEAERANVEGGFT